MFLQILTFFRLRFRVTSQSKKGLFEVTESLPGKVYGICRQCKRFVDFQTFVQAVIIPEALRRKVENVIFILDNGTTHAPKQLEGWLREQAGVCDLRLHF
ncbi:MAG TPA: hypothetical protein VHZ51_00845, partial [Ktedonobacteraceae bacterium]|nr:hypothetical protein [Ktedonobacteraceae bacterium]